MSYNILTSLADAVDSPWQETRLGTKYRQLSLWASVSATSPISLAPPAESKFKNWQEESSSSDQRQCYSNEFLAERNHAKRRNKGDGSGYIHIRYYTSKTGKSYEQNYYHYEIWENGYRQVKSCCYIPKARLEQVRALEANKAPVTKILQVLGKRV